MDILLLCDDLMFTSRISGTARDLGLTFKTARNAEALQRVAAQDQPKCVILDLANPGLDLPKLMETLRAESTRVVAYGSHVDVESLNAARAAGCDPVLPRSKFVEVLPAELAKWAAPGEDDHECI